MGRGVDTGTRSHSGATTPFASSRLGNFFYYDSCLSQKGRNHQQAQTLASRLVGQRAKVNIGSCAQQTNVFDCGMYVIVFSEAIVNSFFDGQAQRRAENVRANDFKGAPAWESRLEAVTPHEVADRRAFYLRQIVVGGCQPA